VRIQFLVSWVVTPCSLVGGYQCFGEICYLRHHHHIIIIIIIIVVISTLKMEAEGSPETLVIVYIGSQLEDHILNE
jgi:hypothetical protein